MEAGKYSVAESTTNGSYINYRDSETTIDESAASSHHRYRGPYFLEMLGSRKAYTDNLPSSVVITCAANSSIKV